MTMRQATALSRGLEILGQAAVAIEPSEGSLDHPTGFEQPRFTSIDSWIGHLRLDNEHAFQALALDEHRKWPDPRITIPPDGM